MTANTEREPNTTVLVPPKRRGMVATSSPATSN